MRDSILLQGLRAHCSLLMVSFIFFFSSLNDNEDDGTVEFRACIKVLADKVGLLSLQRSKLLAAHDHLTKELEEKKELAKSLYAKHQLEKQVSCLFILVGTIFIETVSCEGMTSKFQFCMIAYTNTLKIHELLRS